MFVCFSSQERKCTDVTPVQTHVDLSGEQSTIATVTPQRDVPQLVTTKPIVSTANRQLFSNVENRVSDVSQDSSSSNSGSVVVTDDVQMARMIGAPVVAAGDGNVGGELNPFDMIQLPVTLVSSEITNNKSFDLFCSMTPVFKGLDGRRTVYVSISPNFWCFKALIVKAVFRLINVPGKPTVLNDCDIWSKRSVICGPNSIAKNDGGYDLDAIGLSVSQPLIDTDESVVAYAHLVISYVHNFFLSKNFKRLYEMGSDSCDGNFSKLIENIRGPSYAAIGKMTKSVHVNKPLNFLLTDKAIHSIARKHFKDVTVENLKLVAGGVFYCTNDFPKSWSPNREFNV